MCRLCAFGKSKESLNSHPLADCRYFKGMASTDLVDSGLHRLREFTCEQIAKLIIDNEDRLSGLLLERYHIRYARSLKLTDILFSKTGVPHHRCLSLNSQSTFAHTGSSLHAIISNVSNVYGGDIILFTTTTTDASPSGHLKTCRHGVSGPTLIHRE